MMCLMAMDFMCNFIIYFFTSRLYVKDNKSNGNSSYNNEESEKPKVSEKEMKELAPDIQEILKRSKPKEYKCPFCDHPSKSEGQGFRLHFFTHYRELFLPRVRNLF